MRQFRRFKPYRDRPLCFFDVESTGLKPGYHEVTEVGFRHAVKGPLCLQIAPRHMDRAEADALRISGYNSADWAEAKPFKQNAARITEYLDGATLVGHNVSQFDVPMLSSEYERAGLDHDDLFRDVVDTQQLARTFLVPLGLKQLNMKSCMAFIGEEYEGAHNAYEDAIFAEKLYKFIVENLKWHGRKDGKRIQEDMFAGQ